MPCMKPRPTCLLGDARNHVSIRQNNCHGIHEHNLVDLSIFVSPIEKGEGALGAHEVPHMTYHIPEDTGYAHDLTVTQAVHHN
jgi:hypothetical protein